MLMAASRFSASFHFRFVQNLETSTARHSFFPIWGAFGGQSHLVARAMSAKSDAASPASVPGSEKSTLLLAGGMRAMADDALPIQLVALDLDGTLYEPGRKLLPRTKRALEAVAASGIRIVTVSGQPAYEQIAILQGHGLGEESGLPHAIVGAEQEIYILRDGRYEPVEKWNRPIRARWKRHWRKSRALVEEMFEEARSEGTEALVAPELDEAERYGMTGLVYPDNELAKAGVRRFRERLQAAGLPFQVNRNGRIVQFFDAAAGKGKTVALVGREFGVPPRRTLAVGDSGNDLPMLVPASGFHAATVANADPEVRELIRRRGGFIAKEERGKGSAQIFALLVRSPRELFCRDLVPR